MLLLFLNIFDFNVLIVTKYLIDIGYIYYINIMCLFLKHCSDNVFKKKHTLKSEYGLTMALCGLCGC